MASPQATSSEAVAAGGRRRISRFAPVTVGTALLNLVALLLRYLFLSTTVLLAIIFISYLGLEMATGAPALSAVQMAFSQSVVYVGALLQGDWGVGTAATSANNPAPVATYLRPIFARSLGLLAVALSFAALFGFLAGLGAATRPNANRALPLLLTSIIGVSMPSFFAALLLQLLVVRITRATGVSLLPVGGFGWDSHIVLPALVLAARPLAQITRVTYVSVSEALRADFVRTARSKGLGSRRVVYRHVVRNAAVPILTTMGLSLRFALSSLPVVELFFGWPGAGFTLLKSIAIRDFNTTIALLLCFGALFISVNLLLELAYAAVDPRLRDLGHSAAVANRHTVTMALRETGASLARLVAYLISDEWWRDLERSYQRHTARLWPGRGRDQATATSASRAGVEAAPVANRDGDAPQRGLGGWRRGLSGNLPLLLGALMGLALATVALFGPQLAPHSPFTTQGLEFVDGEFSVPPYEPDGAYPWGTDVLGRDIMSLVMAGAQQTLTLAALAVAARLIIGVLLGALAGWFHGSWLDRTIQMAAEVAAAFPTLLLAMLIILSLGIRGGTQPFLIGLSLVGWGELMQYVRGQVMVTRPRLFIESAVATGAGTPRIVWRHILPNLLPALISLAALEMGAVLMLLGELGFIGIFIGGGAFAELQVDGPPYHYSDVPEWASLLASVRLYARAYPWTAIYPAAAFFVAILGFNLLGEGIRRVVEDVGVQFTRLFNRYTALALVALFLVAGSVRANSGAPAFFREQAVMFQGHAALTAAGRLAQADWSGRALGSTGQPAAATFIAEQFAELGLQRAGEDGGYFVPRRREFTQLTALPALTLDDGRAPPLYGDQFAAFPGEQRGLGAAAGPVHFLAAGYLGDGARGGFGTLPRAIRNLDYTDQILLLLDAADTQRFAQLPYAGLLVVSDDPALLAKRYTLPALDPVSRNFGGRLLGQEAPILWISPELADRILAPSGRTVAELRHATAALLPDEILTFAAGREATMIVAGEVRSEVETAHVIGHLPAVQGQNLGERVILVMAQYDAPPLGPEGAYAGANDNAAGVALMLEIIRTLQATDYRPYKTFLFVAYSGEGAENGVPAYPPDVTKFLTARAGFEGNLELEAVIDLRGVGAGEGNRMAIEAGGSLRLAELFEASAALVNTPTVRTGEPVDISIVFDRTQTRRGGQDAPQVGIRWAGGEATSRTAADTVDQLDQAKLQAAGEAVTLALMVLGREVDY